MDDYAPREKGSSWLMLGLQLVAPYALIFIVSCAFWAFAVSRLPQ